MQLCLIAALLFAVSFSLPASAETNAKILLQNSPLAGFSYYEGKRLWQEMKVGDALQLIREPDNTHDSNAVRVEWQGHKLGYVPRADNQALAKFMDRGSKAEARITRLKKSRKAWSAMCYWSGCLARWKQPIPSCFPRFNTGATVRASAR